MSASSLPSTPSGGAPSQRPIQVALVEERGTRRFKLTYRGETIALENSGSLNRWSATGIVRRHNISPSPDGVTIDGRTVRFEDPQAVGELERLFNELYSAPRPVAKASKPSPATSHTPTAAAHQHSELAKLTNSVHVTRDGFEFHVSYLTKFGEQKTERLEKALDAFQSMRAFKSHVNVQKAGIRLVVTTWDGEHFFEEPGIENIEHATPQEIESLLKRNMHGSSDGSVTTVTPSAPATRSQVTRLQLTKKPHEARFHVVLHRRDGTTEEGPLLIRANLPRLQAEELFRPGINLLLTALNDRVIIERDEEVDGKTAKRAEIFEFKTDEDAKKVEGALNACLKAPADSAGAAQTQSPSLRASV